MRALLALPLWILLQIATAIPTMLILGMGMRADRGALVDRPDGIVLQLAELVATLLTVWLLRRWIDRGTIVSLGLRLDRTFVRDLAAGLSCGVVLISAIFLAILSFGGLAVVSIHPPSTSLLILTIVMSMVAVNEELFVRGYVLSNLMTSTNKYVALVLSSLIFSLFHLFNPNGSLIGLVNIVLAGLLLGVYYIHKRNLWFPIGLHFAWNLLQGGVYGSQVSGVAVTSVIQIETTGDTLLTGGEFGFEASVVTTVLLAAATLAVHLIYRPRPAPAVPPS